MAPEVRAEDADPRPSCPNCESHKTKFKYFNNKTGNRENKQPRYACLDCHTRFTVGDFGRIKPMRYAKKRNQDPPEFHDKTTTCPYCHHVDQARFKYYNNKAKCGRTQPRFLCLNKDCNKQFQMFFDWTRNELVPNKKNKRGTTGEPQNPDTLEPCTIPTASTPWHYDVVNHAERSDQCSSPYDQASCKPSAATEQSSEGDQCCYTQDVLMISNFDSDRLPNTDFSMEQADVDWIPTVMDPVDVAQGPCQIPSEGASDIAASVDEIDQLERLFNSDDLVSFDHLPAHPTEPKDVGRYPSAPEYGEVNAEQEYRLTLEADAVWMGQADVDWIPTVMDPVDVAQGPCQIPSEGASDIAASVDEIDQLERLFNSDDLVSFDHLPAHPTEPKDVGRYPSAPEYGEVNAEQEYRLALEADAVWMGQADVDWLSTMMDPVDVAQGPCQIPSEGTASAYASDLAASAGEVDQFFNSDDLVSFDHLPAHPTKPNDVGRYPSASEYSEVNAEQEDRLAVDADVGWMEQADMDWLPTMMDSTDVSEMPFQVPSDGASSAFHEDEEVNAEQADQFPNTDVVPAMVEPTDISQNEFPAEMKASLLDYLARHTANA